MFSIKYFVIECKTLCILFPKIFSKPKMYLKTKLQCHFAIIHPPFWPFSECQFGYNQYCSAFLSDTKEVIADTYEGLCGDGISGKQRWAFFRLTFS
jgi:hypothetical protein